MQMQGRAVGRPWRRRRPAPAGVGVGARSISILFVSCRSHELLLGALGADDVVGVRDEAPADQGRLAGRADEAVVVPVTVLERDEASAADACAEEERRLSVKNTVLKTIFFFFK